MTPNNRPSFTREKTFRFEGYSDEQLVTMLRFSPFIPSDEPEVDTIDLRMRQITGTIRRRSSRGDEKIPELGRPFNVDMTPERLVVGLLSGQLLVVRTRLDGTEELALVDPGFIDPETELRVSYGGGWMPIEIRRQKAREFLRPPVADWSPTVQSPKDVFRNLGHEGLKLLHSELLAGSLEEFFKREEIRAGVGEGDRQTVSAKNTFFGSSLNPPVFIVRPPREFYVSQGSTASSPKGDEEGSIDLPKPGSIPGTLVVAGLDEETQRQLNRIEKMLHRLLEAQAQ